MASDQAKRHMEAFRRQGRAEQVLYRPGKAGLRPREIFALVDRGGSQTVLNAPASGFTVTALNDDAAGIPSDPRLSDTGTDRIDVAERVGGTRTSRGMQRFVSQDPDWVSVEVI